MSNAQALVGRLRRGSLQQRTRAAADIERLAKGCSAAAIVAAGGIPALMGLLGRSEDDVLLAAVGTLWALADDNSDRSTAIAAAGGIEALVHLLCFSEHGDVLQNAALALHILASDSPERSSAAAAAGGIAALMCMLDRTEDGVAEIAATALKSLVEYSSSAGLPCLRQATWRRLCACCAAALRTSWPYSR